MNFEFPEDFFEEEEEQIPNDSIPILLMGLDGSGKTALFQNFVYGDYTNKPKSTWLLGHFTFKFDEKLVFLQELGGRYRFMEKWENYYPGKKGLIWVVDSIDRGRIIESQEVLDKLLLNNDLKELPVLIIFNKQDGKYKMTDEFIHQYFYDEHYHDKNVKIIKTSFYTLENVYEGFDWLIKQILTNK